MTDTSTTVITALMDGVTPGPWLLMQDGFSKSGPWSAPTVYAAGNELRYVGLCACADFGNIDRTDNNANARFIAAARDLVPALMAERDALAAELAMMNPKVKPLVWVNVPTGYGPETYEAYAGTGFYQVFTDEDSSCGAVFAEFAVSQAAFGTYSARSVARVGSFYEAKAAAQADHEARIMAMMKGDAK